VGNCAGIDWASEKHDVLIADEAGEELLAATFAHDESGIVSLCRAMVRHEVEVAAIERPDGVLVERLLEAGIQVLALHPNQVKAARGSVPRLGREIGSVRSVRLVRVGAHRPPSLPVAGARSG
jgi:transposase